MQPRVYRWQLWHRPMETPGRLKRLTVGCILERRCLADLSTALRITLSTTNPIDSAFSVCREATGRVKRWRDGDMRKRWCVAGLL